MIILFDLYVPNVFFISVRGKQIQMKCRVSIECFHAPSTVTNLKACIKIQNYDRIVDQDLECKPLKIWKFKHLTLCDIVTS